MAENVNEEEEKKIVCSSVNETDGLETAAYRKCHGQFSLTSTENHFQYEIPLDFSPFLQALTDFLPSKYERINSLLRVNHSIDSVKHFIRTKLITCTDLCLYYLKRIQMTNDYYKTMIELNPHVLIEAKQIDEQVNDDDNGNNIMNKLLFGCVAAIKGNISVRDMYNDAGAHVLHEKKMQDDALIVKKLRHQGCVIIGRTNLSEWAYGLTEKAPSGFSAIGGQCLHPDDMHEDVSGSSSGSAAGIKLNLFTFSLGTETQGSLLSPAINVRNVCTLKPSLGIWPSQGIIPINYEQDCCGPMTRNIADIELLHCIATGIRSDDYSGRSLRVGYLGQSKDGMVLLRALAPYLPLTTLIDLNVNQCLIKSIDAIANPSDSCKIEYSDILCYALARDIPVYLSKHSSDYSQQTLSSIIEWNDSHSQFIPYGQTLFKRAVESPINQEQYVQYKETVREAYQSLVNYLKLTYSIDCLLLVGNEDMFTSTTIVGVPRANLVLDYYAPDRRQINVVVMGLALGDDLLILSFLRRLEKAKLQAGKIDIRTKFQKYIQQPMKKASQTGCSIL